MATYSASFSGRSDCTLYIDITDGTPNASANTSVVSFTLRVVGNNASFNGFAGSYSITVNGTPYTGSWTYDFRSDNTVTLRTGTQTITHDTNGNKTITVSGTATDGNGGTPLGTATIGSQNFTTNPLSGTPSAAPTLTRTSTGTQITVVSATSGTTATVTDYEYRQSTDGSTWGSALSMGTDRTIAITGLTATQQYYYQTRVVTANGAGGWSASANVVGIPTAPASITATRTNKNVAVVAGNATGTGITGYWAQASINAGVDWTTPVAMTSQAYTYTNLTPGQTYIFRVYATNSIGNSAYTTSGSVFIPAGGKRWDGSAWNSTATAKRWDGSAWVDLSTAKRWNGSAWVDLS
jgi:hypothetical protein